MRRAFGVLHARIAANRLYGGWTHELDTLGFPADGGSGAGSIGMHAGRGHAIAFRIARHSGGLRGFGCGDLRGLGLHGFGCGDLRGLGLRGFGCTIGPGHSLSHP